MDIKRWIALILAGFLLLGLLAGILPNVSAAGVYTVGLQTASKENTVSAEAGEEVELYVYLANNPGVISVGVTLNCPKGISVVKAQGTLRVSGSTPVWQFSQTTATNPYLVWVLIPNRLVTDNGNICKVTFSVSDTLAPGDYTIKLSAPGDKNLTAKTSGSVIDPKTNQKVTGLTTGDFTVTVKPSTCQHQWGAWETEKQATCEEAGKEVRQCAACQNTQQRTIDATGHRFTAWTSVKKATCTQEGQQKRTCSNAGCTYSETQTLAALGHSFGQWTVVKEATCVAKGERTKTCATCQQKVTEAIAETEHKFEAPKTTKAPTCTQPGEETGKCSLCGKTTKNVLPALTHDFGQPEVVREATAAVPGLKRSKCTRCNAVEETEIPCTTDPTQQTEAETEPVTQAQTEATTEETVAATQPNQPQQTEPTDNKQALYLVIGVAGALLLAILITVIVMLSTGHKKKEDIEDWL